MHPLTEPLQRGPPFKYYCRVTLRYINFKLEFLELIKVTAMVCVCVGGGDWISRYVIFKVLNK